MQHLNVLDRMACAADDPNVPSGRKLVGWERFDDIDCDNCKETLFYEAAERLTALQALHSNGLLQQLVAKVPRIQGQLGDRSVITEGMTPGERLRAVGATMSSDEKVEHLHRMQDLVRDTCPSCGASIEVGDHSEGCLGADPEDWGDKLTDAQVAAELRVQGIDPKAAAARMRAHLDMLEAKYTSKDRID